MTWKLCPSEDFGNWVLVPTVVIQKRSGEFMCGLFFLRWGIELECSW